MRNRISRRLEYDNRVALQQADQAIRKDVVRATVELVTNCNDSYPRLDDAGIANTGVIVVELQRRHSGSVLRVRDYAEGMTDEGMDAMVGTYGGATSGFKEGRSVRGLWGRGLKDAIYGLGHGQVESIHDGYYYSCRLLMKKSVPTYEQEVPVRSSRAIRKQKNLIRGNGTIVEVCILRADVRTPLIDNLRRSLERHFELRAILGDTRRTILLRSVDERGRIKEEVSLAYKPPTRVNVLDEQIKIPGTPALVHLEVHRSDVTLSMPGEEGEYADGGLLVISKDVVLELTLFKYETNEYAARLYGRITCDYIHELIQKDDSLLTATRDGINWKHPFAKALRDIVEAKLGPLVEEERRRTQAEERTAGNKRLREKLNNALKELNMIATSELGKGGPGSNGDGTDNHEPIVPESGFGFVPEYIQILAGHTGRLTLRADTADTIPVGSLVTLESDNGEVSVLTPQVVIEQLDGREGVGQAHVEIEGRQVGAEAVVTARVIRSTESMEAAALVKVISKREPGPAVPSQPRGGGVFRGVHFDSAAEPKQRVRFDRTTSFVVISTQAPSVAAYFDDAGKGVETAQGQVMLVGVDNGVDLPGDRPSRRRERNISLFQRRSGRCDSTRIHQTTESIRASHPFLFCRFF